MKQPTGRQRRRRHRQTLRDRFRRTPIELHIPLEEILDDLDAGMREFAGRPA